MHRNAYRVCRAACVRICLLGVCSAAFGADVKDSFAEGDAAFRAGQPAKAISCLLSFLKASVGDPRIAKAQDMLEKATRAEANRLQRSGDVLGAAQAWMVVAEQGGKPRAESARAEAQKFLHGSFDAAVKIRRYQQAIETAAAFAKLFPDQPPLADATTLLGYRLDDLAVMSKKDGLAEVALSRMDELAKAGVSPEAFAKRKLDRRQLMLNLVSDLQASGWHKRCIELLRELAQSDAPDEGAGRGAALLSKSLIGRAEAWAMQGNAHLLKDAVDDCQRSELTKPDTARLGRLIKLVERNGSKAGAPHQLPTGQPILGEGKWVDDGSGYTVHDEVVLGKQGEKGAEGKVVVAPGFFAEGDGKIRVERGEIFFQGTPERPIILRNLRIGCEFVGTVKATNTVFIDCTFSKDGGWFWTGGYSAKWLFEDCLFYKSSFTGLGRIDQGLKMQNCTFVQCRFPARQLGEDKPVDAAARYLDEWNNISDCDFSQCDFVASALWMTKRGNFAMCHVIEKDWYRSTTDLDVMLYSLDTDDRFLMDARANSPADQQGQVRIAAAQRPWPRARPMKLWAWLEPSGDKSPAASIPVPARKEVVVDGVTRWVADRVEQALDAQVVDLSLPLDYLLDAPIVCLSGSNALALSDKDQEKLKAYVEAGGMILGNADGAKPAFTDSFKKLGEKMFGQKFAELPADHVIYTNQQYPRSKWKVVPQVLALGNGAREFMLIAPTADLARHLHTPNRPESFFQLAANIVLYAVDKQNLQGKPEGHYVELQPASKPKQSIRVARLQYTGNWDPEPGGWRRLGAIMNNDQVAQLAVEPVKLGDGKLAGTYRVAHLTGTEKVKFSDAEKRDLTDFVKQGGTLIVDAAGGQRDFAASVENELAGVFGGDAAKKLATDLPVDHPIYCSGTPITEWAFRPYVRVKLGSMPSTPALRVLDIGGRNAVIYSPMDLSVGLVGKAVDGIYGYSPRVATQLMANLLVYVDANR